MSPNGSRFLDRVREHLGSRDGEGDAAAKAVLEALSDVLPIGVARAVARSLPAGYEAVLRGRSTPDTVDLDTFVARLASREEIPDSLALEHVTAVFAALVELLDEYDRAWLRHAAPPALARFLTDSPASAVQYVKPVRVQETAPDTLARARDQGTRPISEAGPSRRSIASTRKP